MSKTELFHETLQSERKVTDTNSDFVSAYPTTKNVDLAARYGVSLSTIAKWARAYGLRKDPEHWREQQKLRMTGKTHSEEVKAKISQKAMGRTISEETKAKILATKRERGTIPSGESHYKWAGGKPWDRYKNPEYIVWRNTVLRRDNYMCQDCGRKCEKGEKGLAAHHIKSYRSHPDLRLDVSNGVTLCRTCHRARHSRRLRPQI